MTFQDAIEEVKKRVNIVDIISQYVRLKRTGNNYIGLCPFHNEKTPSFSVSESRQIFKCFGCGKGGNVYTFLQEYEGMSFPEAVKYLAARVNVEIEDTYKFNNEDKKKKEDMYKLYKDVALAYYNILYTPEGKIGLDYFHSRNLTDGTIKKFCLGYAPKSYGFVYKMMKEKGYEDKLLMESKLFGLNENGPYDFFYERVMFPLIDSNKNVVSFQGRVLDATKSNKYVNTAESIIYKKSKNLFGINYAKFTKKDYIILCEGNMDVITLNQAGFDNAVASWGTAFTSDQANLIKRRVKKVYLSQDTDAAGIKAIAASYELCKNEGIDTYVLDYSPVKDVDEFINKYGIKETEKKIENPIPAFMFLIGTLKKQYKLNNQYDYEKYINIIVSKLAGFDNPLVREKYIKDVAIQENIDVNKLHILVDKYIKGNSDLNIKKNGNIETNYTNINLYGRTQDSYERTQDSYERTQDLYGRAMRAQITNNEQVEKLLINMLLTKSEYAKNITKYLLPSEFNNNDCKYLYDLILKGKDINTVYDDLENKTEEEMTRISKLIGDKTIFDNEKDIDENKISLLIYKIKLFNLNMKYEKIDKNLENTLKYKKELAELKSQKIVL